MPKLFFAASILAALISANAETIKVGTYNIRTRTMDKGTPNAWENRKSDLLDFVKKMDLDVFGLQEVHPEQMDYIADNLPEHSKIGVHRNDGKRKGEAVPVFFRKKRFESLKNGTFWLSETPDVPGSKSWGTACPRICTWTLLKDMKTGKTFCFANAHTDHKSELARKNGMLLILKRMREFAPDVTPIVFIGDHNCTETSEPAKAVSAILKDALHISETPPSGSWRSFAGWKCADRELTIPKALKLPPAKREKKGRRIDYIYVSDGIKVKSYSTLNDLRPGAKLYPSDHFPVNAVIEL